MPRKNTDLIATSYRYDIKPVGDIPQAVWDTAKAMNRLWNRMVEAHETMLAGLPENAAPSDWKQAYITFIDGISKATAEKQGVAPVPPLTTEAYLIARDYGSELNLEFSQKWAVYERFKTAIQNFRNPKLPNAGKPKFHKRLQSIHLPFRCETGGVAPEWIARRENRIYVRPVDAAVYQSKHSEARHYFGSRGHFDVRNPTTSDCERVTFQVALHRPMPSDTIIKSMALVGEDRGALGWHWGFVLVVNHLPVVKSVTVTHRSAGLDLGWRVRGDALRIGVLWDGARATELLLPLDLATASDKRLQSRIRRNGGSPEHTRHLRDIWELQTEMDAAKDRAKADLSVIERKELPVEAAQMLQGLTKMGSGGLRRLRRILAESGMVLEFLEEWHDQHIRLSKRIRKAQLDWEASKLAIYNQLGDWLARQYDYLVIEKMSLRDIAQEEMSEYDGALYHSRKFRQAAGLYKLRMILKRNFAKYSKAEKLIEAGSAYTTREHHSGTGTAQPSPELLLRYSGGQLEDQDVNAARNLWQALPDNARAVTGIGASVDRSQLLRVVKPLSAVIAAGK